MTLRFLQLSRGKIAQTPDNGLRENEMKYTAAIGCLLRWLPMFSPGVCVLCHPVLFCVDWTSDLILRNRTWQKWWDVSSVTRFKSLWLPSCWNWVLPAHFFYSMAFLCLLSLGKQADIMELPYGEAHVVRNWGSSLVNSQWVSEALSPKLCKERNTVNNKTHK